VSPSALERGIVEAVQEPGCPVCRTLRNAERRYWSFFLHEGFQDPEAALRVARSIGYCRRHADQLELEHDLFAAAKLTRASVLGALEQLEPKPGRRSTPAAGSRCPVCRSLVSSEQDALAALGRLLEDAAFAERYRHSDGLCFDHVGLALTRRTQGAGLIRAHARATLDGHEAQLRRLVQSFDYRAKPADAELASAWKRATQALRGDPGRIVFR